MTWRSSQQSILDLISQLLSNFQCQVKSCLSLCEALRPIKKFTRWWPSGEDQGLQGRRLKVWIQGRTQLKRLGLTRRVSTCTCLQPLPARLSSSPTRRHSNRLEVGGRVVSNCTSGTVFVRLQAGVRGDAWPRSVDTALVWSPGINHTSSNGRHRRRPYLTLQARVVWI